MSSVYDDYMKNTFGFNQINYRNTYEQDYNDYMDYANYSMPQQTDRNNEMLENCYPDIYKLVYPMVQKTCMQNTRAISNELIDQMTDEIYFAIEDDNLNRSVEQNKSRDITNNQSQKKQENRGYNDRQGVVGNQGLRDLIKILILRELINKPIFRPRPPMPRPPRPPRPPMRPGMGRPPFNRDLYEQDENIYEY